MNRFKKVNASPIWTQPYSDQGLATLPFVREITDGGFKDHSTASLVRLLNKQDRLIAELTQRLENSIELTPEQMQAIRGGRMINAIEFAERVFSQFGDDCLISFRKGSDWGMVKVSIYTRNGQGQVHEVSVCPDSAAQCDADLLLLWLDRIKRETEDENAAQD